MNSMNENPVQMLVHQYPTDKDLGVFAHDVAYASANHMVEHADHEAVQAWLSGPFTKSVRRVKAGAKFNKIAAADEIAQMEEVLVSLPTPYKEQTKALHASQLFNEDLPRADFQAEHEQVVIYVDYSLGMSSGKTAAQVAHGVCAYILRKGLDFVPEFSVVLLDEKPFAAQADAGADVRIVDSGLTEFGGQATLTVLAVGVDA